jgi:hypothetical protein
VEEIPVRRFLPLVACLLGVAAGVLAGPLSATHAQIEDLVSAAKPAVVVILVKHVSGKGGHGSGFIFHPSGFILTNQHVVEGATEITVLLPDRRRFAATVVDHVRRAVFACPPRVETWIDAAVLKIEGEGFPTIPLGESDTLRQGQEILVMGYPGGVGTEEVSVTRGIVGAVRAGWLQTDATMLPGNSGGPVLDRRGRVIGLATFGTGMFLRIGGIVAINSIRPMVDAAPTPGAARTQELAVTGLDYSGPVVVGRKRTFRSTRAGQSEYTTEITQIANLAGALVYTLQSTLGAESRSLLGAEGLFTLAHAGGTWKSTFPEPRRALLFPPCPGVTWRDQWRIDDSSDRSFSQFVAVEKIESVGETVTVPAGTFTQTLKIVASYEVTGTQQGGRTWSGRALMTEWWAPGAGMVRSVEEILGGGGLTVTEMVSQFVPGAVK